MTYLIRHVICLNNICRWSYKLPRGTCCPFISNMNTCNTIFRIIWNFFHVVWLNISSSMEAKNAAFWSSKIGSTSHWTRIKLLSIQHAFIILICVLMLKKDGVHNILHRFLNNPNTLSITFLAIEWQRLNSSL